MLSAGATSFAHPDVAPLVGRVVESTLRNQFVNWQKNIFEVIEGAGMGFNCSGDIADATFYREVECRVPLAPDIRARYGLRFYMRIVDDMFFIFRGDAEFNSRSHDHIKNFIRLMELDRRWKYDGWEISRSAVDVLDLTVFKGSRLHLGKASYRIHF